MKNLSALLSSLLLSALLLVGPVQAEQGSLCLPTSGTVSGLTIVTNTNTAMKALATSSSGSSAPANDCTGVPVEGQWWLDTSGANGVQKIYDGTAWETVGTLDEATGTWTPPVGGGATTLASATTTNLWSVPQSYVVITGTTTIAALAGTGEVTGALKTVSFAGALILTYDATQMILPGGRDITTAVGDKALVVALGGGNVAIVDYTPASGMAVQPVPTGHVDQYLLSACPAGWVGMVGGTIGNAASGATRANADTLALFTAMWNLSATASPILTSAGAASTRGASAALDFAANKRLTIPDGRGQFLRGLDQGRGLDTARVLGTEQSDALEAHNHTASGTATSTFTGTALGGHAHGVTTTVSRHGSNGGPLSPTDFPAADGDQATGGSFSLTTSNNTAGTPAGSVSTTITSVTVNSTGSTETRPFNVAVLQCVKL